MPEIEGVVIRMADMIDSGMWFQKERLAALSSRTVEETLHVQGNSEALQCAMRSPWRKSLLPSLSLGSFASWHELTDSVQRALGSPGGCGSEFISHSNGEPGGCGDVT